MPKTRIKYQIDLYYAYKDSNSEIIHAFEAVDPALSNEDDVSKKLAEVLSADVDSQDFNWNKAFVDIPDSVVSRIRSEAIREYQEFVRDWNRSHPKGGRLG